jgi:small-conductance mechanosensitive channel
METFLNDIREEILQYYDALVVFTPRLLLAVMVLLLTWLLARQLRRSAGSRLKKRMQDPLLADFLATMVRSMILIFGFVAVFRILGFSGITAGILAGAGITAFVIGFALRDIGENFLAGILMAFKRPFRVGDFVETTGIRGRVVALSIRDTQLKTPDGKDVYIPNASIIKNPLTNFTIDGYLRFDLVVALPAGADYADRLERIRGAVAGVEGIIRRRRPPEVVLSGVGPGRVDVTICYWIDTFKIRDTAEGIRSEVIRAVQQVLEEPAREV